MKILFSALIISFNLLLISCNGTNNTQEQTAKGDKPGESANQARSTTSNTGLSMDDYTRLVSGDKYVLVDFNATWCQPCKRLAPILESIADQKKNKMVLQKIDVDDNKELSRQKGITGIPYLELYKGGKLVWKHVGYIEEDELLKETNL